MRRSLSASFKCAGLDGGPQKCSCSLSSVGRTSGRCTTTVCAKASRKFSANESYRHRNRCSNMEKSGVRIGLWLPGIVGALSISRLQVRIGVRSEVFAHLLPIARWSSANIILRRAAMPEIKALGLSHPIGFVAMPRTDEWRDDLAHFKMQMGELRPLSGANACDLMAAM